MVLKFLRLLLLLGIFCRESFGEYDVAGAGSDISSNSVAPSSRNPKFFGIFPIVHGFKTESPGGSVRCFTSNGECGRCLGRKQCLSVEGGMPTETRCPGNNAICCLIKLSWNQSESGTVTVKHNLTHIVTSPNLPNQALFTIPRQKGVCQLRLDFKEFSLSSANETGACGKDTMIINGADNLTPPLQLCGQIDPNEHIYLHYGASDLITVNMDIFNTSSKHDILVTMVKCDSVEKAPEGCTQYYTQQRGDVKSFNYPNQQLNNQHYSICIAANKGSQSITWSPCSADPNTDFFISGNSAGLVHTYCPGDRITIPGSINGTYCGGVFDEVQTWAKPFALYVDFDHLEMSPPPSGPKMSNGCPAYFECQDGSYNPIPTTNYDCPGECVLFVGDPINGVPIIQDMHNTGFCLRFRKT